MYVLKIVFPVHLNNTGCNPCFYLQYPPICKFPIINKLYNEDDGIKNDTQMFNRWFIGDEICPSHVFSHSEDPGYAQIMMMMMMVVVLNYSQLKQSSNRSHFFGCDRLLAYMDRCCCDCYNIMGDVDSVGGAVWLVPIPFRLRSSSDSH